MSSLPTPVVVDVPTLVLDTSVGAVGSPVSSGKVDVLPLLLSSSASSLVDTEVSSSSSTPLLASPSGGTGVQAVTRYAARTRRMDTGAMGGRHSNASGMP